MSERISKATFTTLANRPPAAHFGIGKCTILDTGVTYESDGVEWSTHEVSELLWSNKPAALAFGKGNAWFRDIGAIGHSDGSDWVLSKDPIIKKTNGIPIATFLNGISSLFSSTPGAGSVIKNTASGQGVRIETSSGVNLNQTLTFDVTPFLINADTVIGVLLWMSDPPKTDNVDIYVTTRASNFAGYCEAWGAKKPIASAVPLGGGLVYLTWTGALITATPQGNGTVTVGTIIDRMRLIIKSSQGQVIELYKVVINPSMTPMFPIYFDDGHVSQFTEAFNYMSKKGLVGTIGLVGSFVGNGFSLSLEQCQEMYAAGWDLVNHSYTHFGVNTAYGGATPNQVALTQTVLAGANFVLSGSVGSTTFAVPRCLVFTHAGDDSLKRLSVVYNDSDGVETTEVIMGGNGSSTSYLTKACTKIVSITAIDALSNSVTVGLSASYNEIYADLLANKNWLIGHGFIRGLDCYIAPGGQTNALLYDVLEALGITKMRTILTHYSNPFICPAPLSLPSAGNGITSGGSATLIATKNLIKDRWMTCSMYLHEIVADTVSPTAGQARITDFRLVIDSIAADVKAQNLICPTMSEACRLSRY